MEKWDAAETSLGALLESPIHNPSLRGQAFLLLAAVVEHRGQYEPAALVYEKMLLGRIGDASQLQHAQIAWAEAKLRNHELTDAVDMIGRLEKIEMPLAYKATLDLVRLFQQVFMGHHEDAVHDIEERRSLFQRYLSTRAAIGYGLLAVAMHGLSRTSEASDLWRDATTLMTPERLVGE